MKSATPPSPESSRDGGDIELLPAVLEIALDEYPELDAREVEHALHTLADSLRSTVDAAAPAGEKIQALNEFLFVEQGFSGNHDEFYDPRNSYINDVLERKLGIPISLAVLQIECARALDLDLEGVSFPGHFLVRVPMGDGILVMDPYHRGRSVGIDELRQRAQPHFGDRDIDDQQLFHMLTPASNGAIVGRMLRNLKGIYAESEQWDKALRCADRLVGKGLSSIEDVRDRGLFYLRLGLGPHAVADLRQYLSRVPEAGDADSVREALIEAASQRISLQ
ncbi:SirB1 family protein [Pseudomarimonas salicorniae]|uniref:Tetratricopeptide repeat protein n=1 Tax=Pseudomarimonas salicorniae TaxID=2933270 RepID=A0ABT0GJU0_9GAMM|nr:tetratricopeptide repeat protein [Lysobacter sp. CAU 1642]MCK7594632.1 tetratricopeptide repeat protein [Lysobacter sp. CAU 1642]